MDKFETDPSQSGVNLDLKKRNVSYEFLKDNFGNESFTADEVNNARQRKLSVAKNLEILADLCDNDLLSFETVKGVRFYKIK